MESEHHLGPPHTALSPSSKHMPHPGDTTEDEGLPISVQVLPNKVPAAFSKHLGGLWSYGGSRERSERTHLSVACVPGKNFYDSW